MSRFLSSLLRHTWLTLASVAPRSPSLPSQSLEHAQKRGAKILCEYVGGAFSADAYHMTDPNPTGTGVQYCIEKALKMYNVDPMHVNYVNAHGTSTPAGDMAEYRAITNALPATKKVSAA